MFLTFWFMPSMSESTYQGTYAQLRGVPMSDAYASTLHISFDVRGGLLVRQMHHWAAMIFVAAMLVHMMRVFFTGAFRKPRELNWVIGVVLLSCSASSRASRATPCPTTCSPAPACGSPTASSRPRPVVGTYMSFFLFGGEFPGDAIIPRLYMVHVLLIPGLLLALIGAHMLLLVFHKHTQWPGPGRTEQNVVGYPMLPVYMAKAGGFFFMVFGVTALMGGLLSINPVWKYGPYDPIEGHGRLPARLVHGHGPRARCGSCPTGRPRPSGHTISWNVMIPVQVAAGPAVHRSCCCCRSSRPGSPATSGSTTCSSARATPRRARRSWPRWSPSTACSGRPAATTSSPPTCT